MHVTDVTETVRLQEQVTRAEHFAASGRLAASVAHEINTPLQTIQTNLKLMQITAGEEHRVFLGDALEEIRRVGRIVRQLLDFYRPAATSVGPIDVAALLERILLLLGKRIRDQRVTVVWETTGELPLVHGRADELTQVMLNLVVNALDVMPHGGKLTIGVAHAASSGQIQITIGDTGTGIPPDLLEQIFDPFVTTKENGTGLGLSISKQITEQHGGIIRVESTAGVGSLFTIELPLSYTPGN
jgi:signal transduction histidine kinase